MRAGALRHQVEIQSPTRTVNDLNETVLTFSTVGTAWASLTPEPAHEITRAGQTVTVQSFKVTTRWTAGLTTATRLKFGSRIFNVTSIVNPDERNDTLELQCLELK